MLFQFPAVPGRGKNDNKKNGALFIACPTGAQAQKGSAVNVHISGMCVEVCVPGVFGIVGLCPRKHCLVCGASRESQSAGAWPTKINVPMWVPILSKSTRRSQILPKVV